MDRAAADQRDHVRRARCAPHAGTRTRRNTPPPAGATPALRTTDPWACGRTSFHLDGVERHAGTGSSPGPLTAQQDAGRAIPSPPAGATPAGPQNGFRHGAAIPSAPADAETEECAGFESLGSHQRTRRITIEYTGFISFVCLIRTITFSSETYSAASVFLDPASCGSSPSCLPAVRFRRDPGGPEPNPNCMDEGVPPGRLKRGTHRHSALRRWK